MYLLYGRRAPAGRRFPRTRGDVPSVAPAAAGVNMLPPHTRGCTPSASHAPDHPQASPAHAGMYRGGFYLDRKDVKLPPHTRGCTPGQLRLEPPDRASPAHAGMYRRAIWCARDRRRFPRTRGDVPSFSICATVSRSLPPHTRGCTARVHRRRAGEYASPAHAGMYPTCVLVGGGLPGFPRTRGDVPGVRLAPCRGAKLPPHTRGCTRRPHR